VSQYKSLTKFDKGKLLALERDRMGFTREQMAERLRVDWLHLAQLEEGHCAVDEWYLLRAGELTREFERRHQ
jgi:transcriptional regulator with XRE-family HTH domain